MDTQQAQSPFLPGTQIQFAWDSTSLGYLKTCPRLYQYIMIEGWGSRDESVHLRFGIEYHKAVEEFHKLRASGTKFEDALRKVIGDMMIRTAGWDPDTDTRAGKYKNITTLLSLTIDYLDHYRNDVAKTHVKADGVAAVELSFRFELDFGPQAGQPDVHDGKSVLQPYLLCGHLDQVVSYNDALFVQDHKTSQSTLGDYYFDQYSPHNQMTIYTLAGKVMMDSPIRGVVIDAAQILLEKPNAFKRGMTYRTPEQLEEWLQDLRYWLRQAEAYATAGYWPMNDTACDKFGGCRFREICSKSPQVRKMYLKSNYDQLPPDERWNPLKER